MKLRVALLLGAVVRTVSRHFALPDGSRIDEELPLRTPVEIPVLVATPGEIVYSCGMNMDHGTIVVK